MCTCEIDSPPQQMPSIHLDDDDHGAFVFISLKNLPRSPNTKLKGKVLTEPWEVVKPQNNEVIEMMRGQRCKPMIAFACNKELKRVHLRYQEVYKYQRCEGYKWIDLPFQTATRVPLSDKITLYVFDDDDWKIPEHAASGNSVLRAVFGNSEKYCFIRIIANVSQKKGNKQQRKSTKQEEGCDWFNLPLVIPQVYPCLPNRGPVRVNSRIEIAIPLEARDGITAQFVGMSNIDFHGYGTVLVHSPNSISVNTPAVPEPMTVAINILVDGVVQGTSYYTFEEPMSLEDEMQL